MTDVLTSNAKLGIAAMGGITVLAVAAFAIGTVLPPTSSQMSGTIAPVERYRSAQVGDGDVTLGDQSVPQLMQTDIFHLMVNDPSFRTLAQDRNFAALAANPAAIAAMSANPRAFAELAGNPRAFAELAGSARALSTQDLAAQADNGEVLAAMAANTDAFEALAGQPQALAEIAANARAFAE
ncbi:MAG TPA: hypothetical protein VFO00_12485, partial [Vitreimonas sp.]|nr:hypothetical protein [Vitreimonas sp.]